MCIIKNLINNFIKSIFFQTKGKLLAFGSLLFTGFFTFLPLKWALTHCKKYQNITLVYKKLVHFFQYSHPNDVHSNSRGYFYRSVLHHLQNLYIICVWTFFVSVKQTTITVTSTTTTTSGTGTFYSSPLWIREIHHISWD